MDAQLEGLRARFDENPGDTMSFESLEEGYFLAGEWRELVSLYERRLESPELSPETGSTARARLVLRLGQVLEERCLDMDGAEQKYAEAIELDPSHRPAMVQLRRVYSLRERWDKYLALTQRESEQPMRPFERASFYTEVGDVWLHQLGDAQQAVGQFEMALEADADHVNALLGLADAHEKSGSAEQAATALARAIERLRGSERSPVLVSLGKLYAKSLDQPDRAMEAYKRALTDDPECRPALDALADRARVDQNWELFEDLQERLYHATKNEIQRLAVVHEAGRVHLEDHQDAEAARIWFERALELFPDDPVVHLYLADIERMTGNQKALSSHLRRAVDLAENAAPTDLLQESAKYAIDEGDDDVAVEQLQRALDRRPGDEQISADLIAALSRLGRDDELVSLLAEEARNAPSGSEAQINAWLRVGTHHEERLGDTAQALDAYAQAFDVDPSSEAAGMAYARLLTEKENWSDLRQLHERVVRHGDSSASQRLNSWCELGEIGIGRLDDPAGAQEAFQRAVELDPECVQANEGLERVALALGDDDALLEAFEREAEVTTNRDRLSFLVWELARIYESQEEPARALHWLDRLTEASPEDVRALEACARLREDLGQREALGATLEILDPLLTGEAQAKNRSRAARLWMELGDRTRALHATRAVLEAEPDDLDSLRNLDGLLSAARDTHELIDVRRHLVSLVHGEERIAGLESLGRLQMDAGDSAAALDAWSEVLDAGAGEPGLDLEVESLLSDLGRWEPLCARIAARREGMDPLDPRAFELDVTRAELMLDKLDRAEDAIELFDLARDANPGSIRAREGLERALRRADRNDRLVSVLAERAEEEANAEERARLTLERATLLEQTLNQLPEARTVLAEIADGDSALAQDADQRLLALLERTEDWSALRERKQAGLGQHGGERDLEIHLELAELSLERLEDRTAAVFHLEAAAEIDASRAETWQQLNRLYQRAEDHEGTLRAIEAELATGPDDERSALLHARAAELSLDELSNEAGAERHFAALLQLEPSHARAAEFLGDRYEKAERHNDLVALWRGQLSVMAEAELERGADASLRLRMAALLATDDHDLAGAIAALEPAAEREITLSVVAEPLADLYERSGDREALLQLAQRAAPACDVPGERAGWNLRIADALRTKQELAAAAEAYRQVLVDRPEERGAQSALRALYRKLDEPEPLVRLLESELSRVGGVAEIPIRVELADLLANALDRSGDALVHLRRVLQLEPTHASALDRALELATQVERHDETLELLGLAIERTRNPVARSSLLARRGTLEADVLARPAEALESFREAQQLTPHDADINARVRRLLDLTGEWEGSLEAIEREVANLPERSREAKEALLQEAADLAEERVGGDAVLPWLARLRALRPGDTTLLARIAGLHRDAGRFEDLLRTLEEEIAAGPEPERRAALERERAQIFANELQAPGRAIAALEEARKAAPGSTEILRELEGLYQSAGRDRDRAQVLDVLIERTEGVERLKSRRAAAQVAKDLGSTEKSLDYLWQALPDAGDGLDRVEILRELQDLWPRLGRKDLWARVAEAELASLDPSAPVFAERRNEVRWLLADAYRSELARPDKAERHLRALLDETQTDVDPQITQRAQNALIGLLRRSGDAVELEARLSARLADLPTEESQDFAQVAMDWLELARLRKERLHRIGLAAEAYQQASLSDPESLEAVRGLRECADRLGRPADVAAALERELELRADASPSERAGLYRALGEITWRRLDATTRASRAFASALEADPKDRVSLRSLQTLFETMEDWRGAADLYESEVTVLGDDEPGRRQEAWLRVGALSRDHLEEPARALAAYDQAAELGELELAERLHWAELLDDAGEKERFTEVFTSWLDAEGSSDEIADHLRLATTLGEIDQPEEALARVERALALESEHLDAWDLSAQLNERLERFDDAATAHERAAACTRGTDAARRRLQAAHQVDADEDRVRLLDRAVADDPSCAEGHAMLAIAAAGLGQTTQAERASLRALELAKTSELPSELLRDAALSGGRAALEQDHGTQALDLFAAVLEIDPNHTEALAGHGEVALQLGDSVLARPSLEQLLSQEGELPDRAVHLARLGQAVEAAGDTAEALGHYRKALEIDSRLDDAHRGLTELLEREEQIDEAVDALQNWAARTREPNVRAGRLMHAARLELDRPGREEPAEALLREAVSTRPDDAIAWAFLCNLIWSQGRTTEALDQATRAVEALEEGIEVAPCSLIRGRALEQRGDHRAAADAFRLAVECDPRCTEGALSAARLLRALGEWRESADVLQIFVDHAPGDIVDQLAPAWHQLGRLLAGPLEDVDGAIEVYQRALNTDPNIEDARASLADLLVHRPDRWDEATEQHQQLLSEDPTRLASLRGLLQISRGREREDATMAGLAILRALGCASPEERVEAPARLAGATGGSPLSDPTGEMLRQLAGEIAQEIGDALGVGSTGESQLPAGSDPITRLRSALTAAEGQLTAPALVPLTNEELGSVLTLAAELALEVESVQADGDLVNSLSKALGRRTRRRIRKTLDGLNVADLPSIDWNLWRLELRGEAALRALDDIDGELRSAFVAWIEDADGEEAGSLAPESDLRDLVSANPQSLVFLNRLLQHWMSRL